jgi:hypothetical protein
MNGKTAWRYSAMAFDASRDERCPRFLGPIIFQFGVACFWLALAAEGRALQAWQELQAKNPNARGLRLGSVWAHCTQDLREALLKGGRWSLPLVPAWCLPENRKIRRLGLGCMWAVLCPYCSEFHMHSPGEGQRSAHCCARDDGGHYVLEFAGALPQEHHDGFCEWVKGDLPRLVQEATAAEVETCAPLAA